MLTRLTGLGKAAVGAVLALALAACEAPVGPAAGGADPFRPGDPVEVALLVPATGEGTAALAGSLEAAARLAAADVRGAEIRISVRDTRGTPEGAAAAARDAADAGADVIVGPLFAAGAAAAGRAVAAEGLQVLAFSNDARVAGGNVFVLGNGFATSADRLLSFAAARGAGRVFVVSADGPAERPARDAVVAAAARTGATVAGEATFPPSQQGVVAAARDIAGRIMASGATSVVLTSGADGALPYLAELLPEAGLDTAAVRVIGLQRLDVPSSTLSLTGLQGAWFTLPDPGLATQFAARYEAATGRAPTPVAFLGYDAVAAIGALAAAGQAPTRAALTQGSGFAGTGGVFRLNPDGTNTRGLAIAEVRNRQAVVVDPAPRALDGFGV